MSPRKNFQPTLERMLEYQDFLARLMDRMGKRAHLAAPIWHALQREIDKKQSEADAIAAARAHLRRSSDRMEARS